MCDETTKASDRSHKFVQQSSIVAKGYSAPVAIYQPIFGKKRGLGSRGARGGAGEDGGVSSDGSQADSEEEDNGGGGHVQVRSSRPYLIPTYLIPTYLIHVTTTAARR